MASRTYEGRTRRRAAPRGGSEHREERAGRAPALRGSSARPQRAGGALLETMLGLTVLVVGVCTAALSLVSSISAGRAAREQSLALQAGESVMETLLSTPFDEVFARFNATNADDPDPATGPSPGDRFAVRGLAPWAGEPLPGRVLFPGDNVVLSEDAVDPGLGMPRDLDLDGAIDGDDKAGSYAVLPVRVRVRWRGVSGERELELRTMLVDRPRVQ